MPPSPPRSPRPWFGATGHCSALIKLLPDNADLYVAQDTWSSFNSMTRIFKLYDFPFKMVSGGRGVLLNKLMCVYTSTRGIHNHT